MQTVQLFLHNLKLLLKWMLKECLPNSFGKNYRKAMTILKLADTK